MAEIKTQQDLQNAIKTLEVQQEQEKQELGGQIKQTVEKANPFNFIKHSFNEVRAAQDWQRRLVRSAVMLAIGYIAKRLMDRYMSKNRSSITTFVGSGIQVAIATWVAKNGMRFQSLVFGILSKLFNSYTRVRIPQPSTN